VVALVMVSLGAWLHAAIGAAINIRQIAIRRMCIPLGARESRNAAGRPEAKF